MHVTIYREGMSALPGGAGYVSLMNADGQEAAPNGITATRVHADLSGMGEVRISCNNSSLSGSAPSATLTLEYYDTSANTGNGGWVSAGASVTINGAGNFAGSWGTLPAGADDVLLRVTTSDESGNGGVQIQPISITADFRA